MPRTAATSVMFIINGNSSSKWYCFCFIWFSFSHSGDRNWFLNGREELPNQSFLFYFLHAATVGGRGVCVAQTCTDARAACKAAHVGTTRPTPRSKWLRRCAFSDLCRSSTVNSPLAGGIGVRVLPASRVLVPKCYACAFLAQQEKPKTQPESPAAVSYTAYNLAFFAL